MLVLYEIRVGWGFQTGILDVILFRLVHGKWGGWDLQGGCLSMTVLSYLGPLGIRSV